MSSTRAKFDDCAYTTNLGSSVGPGQYMIDTPNNCDDCIYMAAGINLSGKGVGICDKELIDVDSELLNITRKYSQCPSKKYLPSSKPFCKINISGKECTDLIAEPTLLSNPKCTNKETTVNRWEWLCKNPQDNSLITFDYNINNRLNVKDNHRPCLERPIDQTMALPPSCNNYVKLDWASRYTNQQIYEPNNLQLVTCGNIPLL